MIHIRTDENTWVEVKGHAGYAEPGKDIVCAAISVLYETLKLNLREYSDLQYEEEDGLLLVNPADMFMTSGPTLFAAFTAGMKEVAYQYPQYVSYELV